MHAASAGKIARYQAYTCSRKCTCNVRQHLLPAVDLQTLAQYLYDLLSQQLQRLLHLPSVHRAALRSKQWDLAVPP